MKRCPNPACAYIERLSDVETCRKCGAPLVDDALPPHSPLLPEIHTIGAVIIVSLLIACLVVIAAYVGLNRKSLTHWRYNITRWYERVTTPAAKDRPVKKEKVPEPVIDENRPIMIGLAIPMSGEEARTGEMIRCGADLKIEQINKKGGIGGKKLGLFIADVRCDPKVAGLAAKDIAANTDIVAIIGHMCEKVVPASIETYGKKKLAIVFPAMRPDPVPSFSYGLTVPVAEDASLLSRYARDVLGAKTAVIVTKSGRDEDAVIDAFSGEKAHGPRVLMTVRFDHTNDFAGDLTRIGTLKPDVILVNGNCREAALILSSAKKNGITATFLGTRGLVDPELIALAGDAAEGLVAVTPFFADDADTKGRPFEQSFTERYGIAPDWAAAKGYDAAGLIAEAIEKGGANRGALRTYLDGIRSPADAYPGITGPIYFPDDDPCPVPAYVVTVRDGRFVVVE